ncbi:MAG: M48 family metallopeptidase, partial [Promethearchaeota archaeon]
LAEITKVHGKPEDISDEEKIAQVFYSLVEKTKRKDVDYVLQVVNSNDVNAYAMPNGKIVIFSGLLRVLPKNDLSAMAFICAHEISHIEKRHADKIIQNKFLWALIIGSLVRKSDRWVQLLGGIAHGLLTSGYSREVETEADKEGLKLMQKANYDPNGALVLFNILKRLHKNNKQIRIFPNHPTLEDRYKNIICWMKGDHLAIREPNSKDDDKMPQVAINNSNSNHNNVLKMSNVPWEIQSSEKKPNGSRSQAFVRQQTRLSSNLTNLPRVDYSELTLKQIKKGYYLKKWENRLTNDLIGKFDSYGVEFQFDSELKKRARSNTYGKFQSRNEPDRILLVIMLDSYWSYNLFWQHFCEDIFPKISGKISKFNKIGVGVKRNGAKKKHIIILLERK